MTFVEYLYPTFVTTREPNREERLALWESEVFDPLYVRGTRALPAELVREWVELKGRPTFTLGEMPIDESASTHMILVAGDSGRGKTLVLADFLDQAAEKVERGKARLLIHDRKNELAMPLLERLAPHVPFRLVNPLEVRSTAVLVPSAAPGPAGAMQLAQTFVRVPPNSSQPFFDRAVQVVMAAVTEAMNAKVASYPMEDWVALLKDRRHIRKLVVSDPHTRAAYRQVMVGARSSGDVLSTLATHVASLQVVAALSSLAAAHVTVRQLATECGVTVFGGDHAFGHVLAPYYRLIITGIINEILNRQNPPEETICIFDEFQELGEVESLLTALALGRSSRITVCLATQQREMVVKMLGAEAAEVCLNMPQTFLAFGTSSPVTARWMSERLGAEEVWDPTYSENWSTGGSYGASWQDGPASPQKTYTASSNWSYGSGVSYTRRERPVVSVGEFLALPAADPRAGDFRFVGRSPYWPAAFHQRADLLRRIRHLPKPSEPDYLRRDVTKVRLRPFTKERGRQLGLW